MKALKIIDTIILILTSLAFAFGAWGLYSEQGQKEFRELAYVIPDLSMKLGLGLFACHLVLLTTAYFIKARQPNTTAIKAIMVNSIKWIFPNACYEDRLTPGLTFHLEQLIELKSLL